MCREKNLSVPGMGTEDTIMYLLIVGEASEEITAEKPVIKQRGRCVDGMAPEKTMPPRKTGNFRSAELRQGEQRGLFSLETFLLLEYTLAMRNRA